jgi:hypothetical protein
MRQVNSSSSCSSLSITAVGGSQASSPSVLLQQPGFARLEFRFGTTGRGS